MYADVVAKSCTLLLPSSSPFTYYTASFLDGDTAPSASSPSCSLCSHLSYSRHHSSDEPEGGSLVCTWGSEVKVIHFSALWFNRWWVWILWSHSGRAHSGRKRALVARDQWSSLRLSFGPYAPNGWCNEVCKTSLSLHVFGLVPVIGCVKKVWVMTRMRQ